MGGTGKTQQHPLGIRKTLVMSRGTQVTYDVRIQNVHHHEVIDNTFGLISDSEMPNLFLKYKFIRPPQYDDHVKIDVIVFVPLCK